VTSIPLLRWQTSVPERGAVFFGELILVAGSVRVELSRACTSGVGKVPTMVLSETRDQARHYSFVGLSEGAYGAP